MNVIRTPAGKLRRRAAIGVVGLAALGGGGAAIAAHQGLRHRRQRRPRRSPPTPPASSASARGAHRRDQEGDGRPDRGPGHGRHAHEGAGHGRSRRASPRPTRRSSPSAAATAARRPRTRRARAAAGSSFDAAATYIGVTTAELRTQLEAGKSLATIATDNGKTADGLKAALTTAAKKDLDAAVTAGRLTQAQEDKILAALPARLDDEINEVHTGGPGGTAARRPRRAPIRRPDLAELLPSDSTTPSLPSEPRQAPSLRGSAALDAPCQGARLRQTPAKGGPC